MHRYPNGTAEITLPDGRTVAYLRRRWLPQPEALAEHVERVLLEPQFGRSVAEAARRKILAHHTMEGRVRDALSWIETGRAAEYA